MKQNLFPTDALPRPLSKIIHGMHDASGFSVNFLAAAILWGLSVAIGRGAKLCVKATWTVYASLYIALVAPKSKVKSPTLKFVLAPLEEANSAQLNAGGHQLLINDITMEALHKALNGNHHGLGLHRDELSGFFGSFNTYRCGGADEENWLSIYSCMPALVNRKTQREVLQIDKPFVSLIGTIQPAVLANVFSAGKQNGFRERFLWAVDTDDDPFFWNITCDDNTALYAADWRATVNLLLHRSGLAEDNPPTAAYSLSREAATILETWQRNNAIKYHGHDLLEPAVVKNAEQALRISLLLQITREVLGEAPQGTIVDATSAVNAIAIAEYYLAEYQNIANILQQGWVPAWVRELPDVVATAEAVSIGCRHGVSERTVKHWLISREDLFTRLAQGHYRVTLPHIAEDGEDVNPYTAES